MSQELEVFADAELARLLTAENAVRWCREAVLAAHDGLLQSPPQFHTDLGNGRITYTAGRMPGYWYGYRSYDTLPTNVEEQVAVVHDEQSGRVRGVAVGHDLGRIRTGAISSVAADALTPVDATSVGLIGTGPRAWTQLWALLAVRRVQRLTVYGRDAQRRKRFADQVAACYDIHVRVVDSADAAVSDVDIAMLATDSPLPMVETAAIAPETHVTAVVSKKASIWGLEASLASRASLVVTDAPHQLRNFNLPSVSHGTRPDERLVSLGSVLTGETEPRPGAVFFCVGLNGTDTYLLARLLGLPVA